MTWSQYNVYVSNSTLRNTDWKSSFGPLSVISNPDLVCGMMHICSLFLRWKLLNLFRSVWCNESGHKLLLFLLPLLVCQISNVCVKEGKSLWIFHCMGRTCICKHSPGPSFSTRKMWQLLLFLTKLHNDMVL